MVFLCYTRCSTCKNAQKWLDEHGFEYELREIKTENPTVDELKAIHEKSGLPLKRLFNTSGLVYKALGLKDKLADMSDEEQFQILSTDGMLVKRPILIMDNKALIGFRQAQWEEALIK